MGRGSSGAGTKDVAWNRWGKRVESRDIRDENGDVIGYIEDTVQYDSVPYIQTVTKKEVLADIDGWRNDDGTYGNEDTAIYLAYKDGSFVDADDLGGKAYKKAGIVGASISTGDYEMVWGGEMRRRNGRMEFSPWETWSEDGESGHQNSYSGYTSTQKRMLRWKVTFNNPNGRGGYKTKREIIRQSEWVPLDKRGF